jgi:hypothetical protein
VSAFSDPRWFDREAAVEREDVVCRAVPQADGGYLRAAETQSGGHLSVATFRICEGPLTGHHAGLLLWPPRNAADRERALGALADTPDERLEERLAETAVRCRIETSPFGELEVRKVLEIAPACELPPPAGPNPPIVREDVLPPQPPEAPATRIMVLRDADEWASTVSMVSRDCGLHTWDLVSGELAAVTQTLRQKSGVTSTWMDAEVQLNGSHCQYAPNTFSRLAKESVPSYSDHRSVLLSGQPFAFAGDLILASPLSCSRSSARPVASRVSTSSRLPRSCAGCKIPRTAIT